MLEYLQLTDFKCIRSAELRFDGKPGVTLIVGDNRVADYADSNAAGKSTLWRGLMWALFGKFPGMTAVRGLLRRDAGQGTPAVGAVQFTMRGKRVHVKRTRTRAKETVEITYDGAPAKSWDVAAANEHIASLFGISYDQFSRLCIFTDAYTLASQGDADLKALFSPLIPVDVTPAAGVINAKLKDARAIADAWVAGRPRALAEIQQLTTSVEAEERAAAAWETQASVAKQTAADAVIRARAFFDEARKLQTQWRDYRITQEQTYSTTALDAKIQATMASRARNERTRLEKVDQRARLQRQPVPLQPVETCNACGQALPAAARQAAIAAWQVTINDLSNRDKAFEAEIAALRQLVDEEDRALAALHAEKTAAVIPQALSEARAGEDAADRALGAAQHALQVADRDYTAAMSAKNVHTAVAAERRTVLRHRSAEFEQAECRMQETLKSVQLYSYVAQMVSKGGLQHFLLESLLPDLSARASVYLSALSTENMRVRFASRTENDVEKFHVMASSTVGATSYDEMSNGEKRRIDGPVFLAAYSLARRVLGDPGVLFVDELIDTSTDRTAKTGMLTMLAEYAAQENQQIFVITNDTNVMNDRRFCRSILRVVAAPGGSILEHA